MAFRWVILWLALASPAAADPVSLAGIAIAAAGTAAVGSAGAIGAALGISATLATVGIAVAVGFASLGVQLAFGGRVRSPRQPDLIRELALMTSLPPYRFVYGRTRVFGTPAPFEVVGNILYGALILNSRPSAGGTIEIDIDKVPVTLSGDIYAGAGAEATNAPFAGYAQFWLTRGGQTSPPSGLLADDNCPFSATDGWTGRTVLWCRLDAGPSRDRADRWRRVPPDIEVVMDGCRIRDFRDPEQTADPATWQFSRNRAMIVLDALLNNPARPYPLEQIDLPSFIAAANSDDEAVPLKAGGTEPRYRADGVVVWQGGEVEELVAPIAEAGAGRLTRVGGRVAMTPGVWTEPVVTLTDVLDDGLSFEVLKPGRDLASVVTCRYTAPSRGYEMADLAPFRVPGAEVEGADAVLDIELPWVTSPTQAMRVQKILALRQRQQKRLVATFPPNALRAVSGSTVAVTLPAPFAAMNDVYEVQSIAPVAEIAGAGVAMRCPMDLIDASASIYNWAPEQDEQDLADGVAVPVARPPVSPPGAPMLLTTGAATALDTGDAIVPRILVEWTPTPSLRATGYEVQFRVTGGDWVAGPTVGIDQINSDDRAFAFLDVISVGVDYEVRVRAVALGAVSAWLDGGPITAGGPDVTLNAPTGGVATGGEEQISITFTAANDADFWGIEFFGSDTDDFTAATLIAGPIWGPPNSVYGFTEDDLGAEVTRYYFARAVGPFGARSAFSASASATTNP